MRSLFIRQPWMACGLLLLTGLFVLFLVADRREMAVARDLRSPYYTHEPKDARPLFEEAHKRIVASSVESIVEHMPLLGRASRPALGAPYPAEQRAALRAYLTHNVEALAVTEEIARCNRYDVNRHLWRDPFTPTYHGYRSVHYRDDRPITAALGAFRRFNHQSARGLSRETVIVLRLMGCAMLEAILDGAPLQFQALFERTLTMTTLFMDPNSLPYLIAENLEGAFLALDMLEEAVNRLPFDTDALDAQRLAVAEQLYNRENDFARAFQNHLVACTDILDGIAETSRMPVDKRRRHGRPERYRHDRSFEEFQDSWLSLAPLHRRYYLFALREATRLAGYSRYGGAETLFLSPERLKEAKAFREFLDWPGRYRTIPPHLLSSARRALEEEKTLLWPYYQDFEPYVALLAQARAADSALAALQFFRDRGHFPDALEELTPRYMAKVPRDPYTHDSPLRYDKDANRVVVYSLGPNFTDNGGHRCAQLRKRNRVNQEESKADIVFVIRLDAAPLSGTGCEADTNVNNEEDQTNGSEPSRVGPGFLAPSRFRGTTERNTS